MSQCGNFLEYAGSKCGVDVGFGKMILLYKEKVGKKASDLTATAINDEIAAGRIIGIVKGWHTVAGAPVAEINVERTGTAEMKLIRPEILADTLTFENSVAVNEIIGDLVKMGTGYGILLDDQGNAFGDFSSVANQIMPMNLNFSGKVTSTMQATNNAEKTLAVTVRYLVKDLSFIAAGTETEWIESKTLLVGQVVSISANTIVLLLKDKSTNTYPIFDNSTMIISIDGSSAAIDDSTYTESSGLFTINFSTPLVAGEHVHLSLSGDTVYMKEIIVTIVK